MIYKGTTPTYTLTFEDETLDFAQATDIIVTISTKTESILLELTGDDLEISNNTISFSLTQAQTLSMPRGNLLLQVNWTYTADGDTKRACSNITTVSFRENLHDEVM